MAYGQIAACIPKPGGIDPLAYRRIRARWVGYAMASCPEDVPWHRVVNRHGEISPRFGFGPDFQKHLLAEEGLQLNSRGRLNLEALRWEPDPRWLAANGFLDLS